MIEEMGNSNSGRRGLPHAKRREIMRLIVDGRMTDAQISRECGVHVTTIVRIRRQILGRIKTPEPDNVRCPGCGALIVITSRSPKQCLFCLQEKTVMPKMRSQRVARIARRRRRSQKPHFPK